MEVLLILLFMVGAVALVIRRQPNEFSVSRSTVIKAPAAIIFPLINSQRASLTWSPWAKLDTAAIYTFEGPDEGVGSVVAWEGNNKIGAGRSTIIESKLNELVRTKLEFFKPMKGQSVATLMLAPHESGTLVTWSMEGPTNFIGKAMSMIIDCSKMIGGHYEEGLANLKLLSEKGPSANAA